MSYENILYEVKDQSCADHREPAAGFECPESRNG